MFVIVLGAFVTMLIVSADRFMLNRNAEKFNRKLLILVTILMGVLSLFIVIANILWISPLVRVNKNFFSNYIVNNFNTIFLAIFFTAIVNMYCLIKRKKYAKTFYFYMILWLGEFIVYDTLIPYIQDALQNYFLIPRINYFDLVSMFIGVVFFYFIMRVLNKPKVVKIEEDKN